MEQKVTQTKSFLNKLKCDSSLTINHIDLILEINTAIATNNEVAIDIVRSIIVSHPTLLMIAGSCGFGPSWLLNND